MSNPPLPTVFQGFPDGEEKNVRGVAYYIDSKVRRVSKRQGINKNNGKDTFPEEIPEGAEKIGCIKELLPLLGSGTYSTVFGCTFVDGTKGAVKIIDRGQTSHSVLKRELVDMQRLGHIDESWAVALSKVGRVDRALRIKDIAVTASAYLVALESCEGACDLDAWWERKRDESGVEWWKPLQNAARQMTAGVVRMQFGPDGIELGQPVIHGDVKMKTFIALQLQEMGMRRIVVSDAGNTFLDKRRVPGGVLAALPTYPPAPRVPGYDWEGATKEWDNYAIGTQLALMALHPLVTCSQLRDLHSDEALQKTLADVDTWKIQCTLKGAPAWFAVDLHQAYLDLTLSVPDADGNRPAGAKTLREVMAAPFLFGTMTRAQLEGEFGIPVMFFAGLEEPVAAVQDLEQGSSRSDMTMTTAGTTPLGSPELSEHDVDMEIGWSV
mmetsp:Transcript_13557/g.38531  ORF Transcript_13557/g.38531 Transcript_13557/m.38531 type:complete len:438 (-) Transcript_13557:253-1566(-)